jgi:hypothetical protein
VAIWVSLPLDGPPGGGVRVVRGGATEAALVARGRGLAPGAGADDGFEDDELAPAVGEDEEEDEEDEEVVARLAVTLLPL